MISVSAKYIEGLENRLARMEHMLRLSGALSEDDNGKTDLGTLEKRLAEKTNGTASPASQATQGSTSAARQSSIGSRDHTPTRNSSISSPTSTATTPDAPKQVEGEVEALSDLMCSLVTNNCGETRYIGKGLSWLGRDRHLTRVGSSSSFSIFSPKGLQWVNEKTGDTSFHEMISSASADDNKWIHWKGDVFDDIFARRSFKPLPPKEEAVSLLQDYFVNFNCMFPLFHEPTFMHLVNMHYSRDPYEGSGWWASLNTALAIAHRLRVMSNLVSDDEDQKAWGYLKNALGVVTELTMRNTDLLSVQALLGMVSVV